MILGNFIVAFGYDRKYVYLLPSLPSFNSPY